MAAPWLIGHANTAAFDRAKVQLSPEAAAELSGEAQHQQQQGTLTASAPDAKRARTARKSRGAEEMPAREAKRIEVATDSIRCVSELLLLIREF